VLKSSQAVQVNIEIMRAFVQLKRKREASPLAPEFDDPDVLYYAAVVIITA